jgi:hypothetical protein
MQAGVRVPLLSFSRGLFNIDLWFWYDGIMNKKMIENAARKIIELEKLDVALKAKREKADHELCKILSENNLGKKAGFHDKEYTFALDGYILEANYSSGKSKSRLSTSSYVLVKEINNL